MSLFDDLQEDLARDALEKPAAKRDTAKRQLEWSNAQSFTDGGYIAKVARQHCLCCDGRQSQVLGIFHCEIAPNGTRRLQALTKGAQWPLIEGHTLEYDDTDIPYCAECLGQLGFTKWQSTPGTYTRYVGEPFGLSLGDDGLPQVRL